MFLSDPCLSMCPYRSGAKSDSSLSSPKFLLSSLSPPCLLKTLRLAAGPSFQSSCTYTGPWGVSGHSCRCVSCYSQVFLLSSPADYSRPKCPPSSSSVSPVTSRYPRQVVLSLGFHFCTPPFCFLHSTTPPKLSPSGLIR